MLSKVHQTSSHDELRTRRQSLEAELRLTETRSLEQDLPEGFNVNLENSSTGETKNGTIKSFLAQMFCCK
ncbi:uncharacterized protein PRCAT00005350001 [Priceomyces carsonii]|uniref:uncharacterized protein n=1 Tax=Priceomyces carsonii TaxID=28549 RepID=UPI002EDA27A9|nr:unnamed protein product [Priceomyces carsonii]